MTKSKPIQLNKVKTYSLMDRPSKVSVKDFGKVWKPEQNMDSFISSLPDILGGNDLKEIISKIVKAFKDKKQIILAMGAHPIKVGLNPVIIDLMERGIITALAMNGAGIIHDTEIAMAGKTSEDVAAHIGDGQFGMAKETGEFLNNAINKGAERNIGLGDSVGAMLVKENFKYNQHSLLANAHKLDIPVTVHVAIGTDIIHFHPLADGASMGKTSHIDFRIFSNIVSKLENGVFINLGSAVIMPEIFLKALTLTRNLGHNVKNFTTVNMDFIRGYRPMTNIVNRPTLEGGKGYALTGHHEIMFPLLAAGVIEKLR